MDDVATPTSYEPQDLNLPPGTQGRVTVHYSATTMAYERAHLRTPTCDPLEPREIC